MINKIVITLFAAALVFSSCVTKPYKSPSISPIVDSLYRVLENKVDTSVNEADVSWREFFTDTMLVGYIEQVLDNNFDMQIAVRNILKAEAQLRQSKSAYAPTLSVGGGYAATMPLGSGSSFATADHWSAQFGWEIDLWGKIASAKRSAYASLLAEKDNRQALQSTLVAQTATLYYTLVCYDAQVDVIRQTIKNRKAYLSTTRQLKESAMVSVTEVAVQQAIAQLAEAQAALPKIEMAIIMVENAFRALLSQPSGTVERHRVIDITNVTLITQIGCSSQLLANRADLRSAEKSYRAAHEMWNVSRAAMYPSLTISAQGDIGDIFNSHFGTLNLLAGLTEPLWNGRRLRTQKEVAKLSAEQAELNFRKSLLTAGQEVSDALASQLKTREIALAQVVQLKALRLSHEYSMELFVNGYATYLDVLVAQTGVFNTELSLISTYKENLEARIELYRALGGGSHDDRNQ